ncbi:MAG: hypothetical protein JSR47_08915 [Proteobacteria bacterium]|nr:hypothetical protein [Pseudomonadota bacterium]
MAVSSGFSVPTDIRGGRSTWTPSWPLAFGLIVFVWLSMRGGMPLLVDPDTQWHVALGNWIVQHRAVPHVDTMSFTFTGQPWIAKEWLSQLLLAGAFDLGGWTAVVVLASATFGLTFALLLRLLLRDIKPLPALLFTGAAVAMVSTHFMARPYVFAFPCLLLWVHGLVRAVEERRAPSPVLLAVMLVWANLHGGFTFGLMLAGAFGLEALVAARDTAERKRVFVGWLKFGVGALLAACVTPYGPESILVTLRIFQLGDSLSLISEWKSPNFQTETVQEVVLLVGLYVALSRGLKLPLLRLLILIGLVHMYLRYSRNAELLALVAPLVIAPVIARLWPTQHADAPSTGRLAVLAGPAGHGALAVGLALALVFAGGLGRFGDVKPPSSTVPQAALDYVRETGIKGRVLNYYGYGGFLIRSGIPTFIDGRGELFGGPFIKLYADAVTLNGDEPLETILERYKIDWTFLARNQAANQLLGHLPGWKRVYGDDEATIFVRERKP